MRFAVICLLTLAISARAFISSRESFIQPVPLQDVRLKPDSRFDKAVSLNREYLLGIDSDRLLKTFRLNAGLDAPGEAFTGSWEDPTCEVRGQYLGHWLSGTAVLGNYTGDEAVLSKAAYIVEELSKVQDALGNGYLSAFPLEHLERLKELHSVWAPLYVIHKIMAGLLDQYLFLGNKLALRMVTAEAEFLRWYMTDILWWRGESWWRQMLETEYGGMEEVLFNLANVTGDVSFAEMARFFTKPNFFEPLLEEVDTLPGRHANTHLAQVAGFAAGYEQYGDQDRLAATSTFFEAIKYLHSYATGGSNANEYWGASQELGPTIGPEGSGRDTEETCTTYNMMKITRYLFRFSGEAKFADFYERAILNGMLGTQRMPADYSPQKSLLGDGSSATSRMPGLESRSSPIVSDSTPHRHLMMESPTDVQTTHDSREPGRMQVDVTKQRASLLTSTATQPVHPNTTLDWRSLAAQKFPGSRNSNDGNEPGPGVIIYLMPLGAANTKDDSWHHWSTPLNSFWCCSGSTSEQFGKLMDSIFFQRHLKGQEPELFVNQLTPATLKWKLGNLDIVLEASLEDSDGVAKATLSLDPYHESEKDTAKKTKSEAVLKLRIPGWLDTEKGGSVSLNGGEVVASGAELTPESYLAIKRAFKSGDKIEMRLPMKITTEMINDWRTEFFKLKAVMMGPFVMAALTDGERSIQANAEDIEKLIKNVSIASLFSFAGPDGTFLKQNGASGVSVVPKRACLSRMDCTFRLLTRRTADQGVDSTAVSEDGSLEEAVLIESMHRPGHFLTVDSSGQLEMVFGAVATAQTWHLSPVQSKGGALGLTLAAQDSRSRNAVQEGSETATDDKSQDAETVELHLDSPLGDYPAGARLLVGEDRSYVIAPLGNLIEERYSPYLSFEGTSAIQ